MAYQANSIFILLIYFTILFMNTQIFAANTNLKISDIPRTSIKTMRGNKLPTNLLMRNHNNQVVTLKQYFNSGKPVILTMGYFSCDKLCDITISNMINSIKNQSLKLGRDFSILSININPNENNNFIKIMRSKYLKLLKIDNNDEESWVFLSADDAIIRKISESIGFEFNYRSSTKKYDHDAVFFVFSPNAVLCQTFHGISFDPFEIKKSLLDAARGRVGSYINQIVINCIHYTANYGKYKFFIIRLIRGIGILTIMCLIMLFFKMQKRDKKI